MKNRKKMLAVDLGASSGRVMLGEFDGEKIALTEVHRFSNDPVMLGKTMYWDFLRLMFEIKQGLVKAKAFGKIDSISVDTWGVDYGLLDQRGELIGNPVHYRDARTVGWIEKSFERIDRERFYQITGIEFMEFNTVFQLLAQKEDQPELLERADCLLLMADLILYYLSGVKNCEYSAASTTQLMDAAKRDWSEEVLEQLEIPKRILQPITPSGTALGMLTPAICEELGVEPILAVAGAGHDTQCAMAAVPAEEEAFIFVSCGTWSLFGTELAAPIIDEKSTRYAIANEGGVGGKISFLKNIIGLWLIQESRRQWIREGKEYGFGELEKLAGGCEPFRAFIDPSAAQFNPAGNIPRRIREYCRRTGQAIPETEGEIVRCIDESLAFKYRMALDEIRECTGKEYHAIHIVGGGAQSALLCQMTANACGCTVYAGPVEATVYGNLGIQLMADGSIDGLTEMRRVIRASEEIKVYEPQDADAWNAAFARYLEVVS